MQENLKHSLRLTAGALAVATSLFAGGSQAAPSYMAVLPLAGLDANQGLRPVDIALADATPPAAMVGVPYEFNLGALLSLDGPTGTTPDKVSWSVSEGELPAGLSLVGSRVVGTPTELVSGRQITIRVAYPDGHGPAEAMAAYLFSVAPAELTDLGGYRAWADGTFAISCEAYIRSPDPVHPYSGATGDGVYRIAPAYAAPFDVYCDQTTDTGGWTLVAWSKGNPGKSAVPPDFFVTATNADQVALAKRSTNSASSLNTEGFSRAVNTSDAMLVSAAYSAKPIIEKSFGTWGYTSPKCTGVLRHTGRDAGCMELPAGANDEFQTSDRFNLAIDARILTLLPPYTEIVTAGIAPYYLNTGRELCYPNLGWCDFEFYLR